jgi:hypothetical protein
MNVLVHFRKFNGKGLRIFNINVEGKIFANVDLVAMAGFLTAFTLEAARVVDDGAVTITLTNANPMVGSPKINGIAIKLLAPHFAHSVANGPYTVVDATNAGSAVIAVDGSNSHTHGPGLVLNQWIWKSGATILARGEFANLVLPVGQHSLALTVIDNGGNESIESTSVTVLPFGFPLVSSLSPTTGTGIKM